MPSNTEERVSEALGYTSEPFTKSPYMQGLGTVAAIVDKMYNPETNLNNAVSNTLIDGAIGSTVPMGKRLLEEMALSRAAAQYAIDQGLLASSAGKIPWGSVLRAGARGAGVAAAGTAAFELGYYAGTQLDNQFGISSKIAKTLEPGYDPSDTSYRDTEEYQKALENILKNRRKREEEDRLKREKIFGK